MQLGSQPHRRTGPGQCNVFIRWKRRILKTLMATTTPIPEYLRSVFPPSIETTASRYITDQLLGKTHWHEVAEKASQAIVYSATFISYKNVAGMGHALLICDLRHPACPECPIAITLERFAKTGGDPSSSASSSGSATNLSATMNDAMKLTTPENIDSIIIKNVHEIDKIVKFAGPSMPTLLDILALAKLVTEKYPLYSLANHCIFYALVIFDTLQQKFNGVPEKGPHPSPVLPFVLGMMNSYTQEFKRINESFDGARADLQGQVQQLAFKEAQQTAQAEKARKTAIVEAENTVLVARNTFLESLIPSTLIEDEDI
ncbi:hypothetical protein FB451DRAFT_1175723 [Mycena latifolia]|nr:hypothetical protein FB451DRAFT_1175723 [Mycena latifolia]